jgi:hypothetical protein
MKSYINVIFLLIKIEFLVCSYKHNSNISRDFINNYNLKPLSNSSRFFIFNIILYNIFLYAIFKVSKKNYTSEHSNKYTKLMNIDESQLINKLKSKLLKYGVC